MPTNSILLYHLSFEWQYVHLATGVPSERSVSTLPAAVHSARICTVSVQLDMLALWGVCYQPYVPMVST